jgi:glycerophosphoryl diester phosphodiesterase/tryptophanyl-tRNA synthetase
MTSIIKYAGVWRRGNEANYVTVGLNQPDFIALANQRHKENLTLIDIETYVENEKRLWTGVWVRGNDANYVSMGLDQASFIQLANNRHKENLTLIDIESYVENGKQLWAGVWRTGNDANYVSMGLDQASFIQLANERHKQNLTLIDIETYVENGKRLWAGVWVRGNDANYVSMGLDQASFIQLANNRHKENLTLIDIESYVENGKQLWAGVWRTGNDANYVSMGLDQASFIQLANERHKQNLTLIDIEVMEVPLFGPRPFYIIGHNTNTIAEVNAAIDAGANAIEPDVNVYEDKQSELCISHDKGEPGAPSLVQFLKDLRKVVLANPKLSLVVFDCKERVATAQHGLTLLNAIRTFLTFDTDLNVIISVAKLQETSIFKNILSSLSPCEGLMIDEENDPVAVSDFFTKAGVDPVCFGNGISVWNSVLGPNVRPSMELACELRAANNRIKFIYVWTVNNDNDSREYIRIGVDGIITDEVADLHNIVKESQFHSVIRMAKRSDNPFIPANFAYGLKIYTGDKSMAGTDANVTFTLTGTQGSSSLIVDTSLNYRMERNDWNYVTLQSPDLGDLISITVQRDNDGNAPSWYLGRIIVESFRFGVLKQADFNLFIDTTSPFTRPLL